MKTIAGFLLTFFLSIQTYSQVLNGSFETTIVAQNPWVPTFDTIAQYWMPLGMFGGELVNDAADGNKAVKIWSWYFGQSNTTLEYGAHYYIMGHPNTQRPLALSGQYKFHQVNSNNGVKDSALAQVFFSKHNPITHKRDTIGGGEIRLGEQQNYTGFSIPVSFSSSAIPDTLLISFRSSFNQWTNCNMDGNGNCNYLYLDKLAFVMPVGMNEEEVLPARIYPNPFSDVVKTVEVLAGEYRVFNSLGVLVHQGTFTGELIDLSELSPGIYFLELRSEGITSAREKILKE
jgi:hypothetical protein